MKDAKIWDGSAWQSLKGPPGPSAVSADAGNAITLGSDGLVFSPSVERGLWQGTLLTGGPELEVRGQWWVIGATGDGKKIVRVMGSTVDLDDYSFEQTGGIDRFHITDLPFIRLLSNGFECPFSIAGGLLQERPANSFWGWSYEYENLLELLKWGVLSGTDEIAAVSLVPTMGTRFISIYIDTTYTTQVGRG